MIFKDWHESDQLLLIYIQYWNRKQFYSCCAVAAMDHVLTGTLPSNYSQQPMRIKDSSAVHLSDVLLAVSKCLLHIIELVDKEWAHPWSEWAHPLSMNEHIPVSGFRVLSLPSAGKKNMKCDNDCDWVRLPKWFSLYLRGSVKVSEVIVSYMSSIASWRLCVQ